MYVPDLVSVILPTYRRSDSLTKAIESVLNQTYKNIECIVVNDNNPNDEYSLKLYEVIELYRKDSRFVFVEQEKHVNGAEARNCGIRRASGEFIAFLDDDDWWDLEKIEKQVTYIRSLPLKYAGVSTLVSFYKDGVQIRKSLPYRDGAIVKSILRREVDVTTCSLLLKHTALDETGYFDNTLKRHQEIQLLAFFTCKYQLKLLREHLTFVAIDDSANRPDSELLKKYKEDFFESVDLVVDTFSKSEKKRIRALHSFELAYIEYKEKKYLDAIKDAISVLHNPKTLFIAIKRIVLRKIEYKIVD